MRSAQTSKWHALCNVVPKDRFPQNLMMSPSVQVPDLVRSLMREGVDVRLRLSGWSMKPILPSGSFVRFTACDTPVVGDVVLAHYPGNKLVAHRVIGLSERHVWTKGDSCRTPDGPIERSAVLGCATTVDRPLALPFRLPMRNRWMRGFGLGMSRLYPWLVRGYRRVRPVKNKDRV